MIRGCFTGFSIVILIGCIALLVACGSGSTNEKQISANSQDASSSTPSPAPKHISGITADIFTDCGVGGDALQTVVSDGKGGVIVVDRGCSNYGYNTRIYHVTASQIDGTIQSDPINR